MEATMKTDLELPMERSRADKESSPVGIGGLVTLEVNALDPVLRARGRLELPEKMGIASVGWLYLGQDLCILTIPKSEFRERDSSELTSQN